jgi:hypothetical protein
MREDINIKKNCVGEKGMRERENMRRPWHALVSVALTFKTPLSASHLIWIETLLTFIRVF